MLIEINKIDNIHLQVIIKTVYYFNCNTSVNMTYNALIR